MSSLTLRKIIFLLLLATLILPLIQSKFNLVKIHPLKGAITQTPDTSFSWKGWFAGGYQEQKEKYLNESFGFRNLFIRMNNQVAFNLFDYALANGVIIGKKNYLYEENYIKAYYGLDFVGTDSINRTMQRLKFIQDTLTKLNKTLLVVFASSKGTYYPEFFPDRYNQARGTTNYEIYLKDAKDMGINYIDFNKYFVDNKNKSKYPLYSKYGIHWSYYGECLAADSIIKTIEKLRNIKMPHIFWDKVNMDKRPRERDADIEDGMNLLFNLKSDSLAYPVIKFQSDSGKTKPSSIIIADSYYWGMFGFDISRVYSDTHFWFYNNTIYPDYYTNGLTAKQVDLKDQIAKHDIIIIMATDATSPNLGWGFIENAYNTFKGYHVNSPADERAQIMDIANKIKVNAEWMAKIAEGAKRDGISLDSALILNAIWVRDNAPKK